MKTTSELLSAAAEYLENGCWGGCGGNPNFDVKGLVFRSACMGQAVWRMADLLKADTGKAGDALCRALGHEVKTEFGERSRWAPVYAYNDTPGRTKEEVIAMLRAVAATERARERPLTPVNARLLPVVVKEVERV